MAKPVTLIPWDSNLTNIVTPDTDHQDDGWLAPGGVPEKPPYQYFNHMMNQTTRWLDAFSDFYDDVLRLSRPQFAWVSNTELSIAGGAFFHWGTTDQILKIDTTISHTITSPGTSQFQYIYVDDSAIVTAGTNVLTATEIINSTTEPTYSITKNGWYNGDDLCIFGQIIDGSGYAVPFDHSGDFVTFEDVEELATTDIDASWVPIDLSSSIPSFATLVRVWTRMNYVDGTVTTSFLRKNNSDTEGVAVNLVDSSDALHSVNTLDVITDTSQIIEIIHSQGNGQTSSLNTQGWYFPRGM